MRCSSSSRPTFTFLTCFFLYLSLSFVGIPEHSDHVTGLEKKEYELMKAGNPVSIQTYRLFGQFLISKIHEEFITVCDIAMPLRQPMEVCAAVICCIGFFLHELGMELER